ncbi:MAG: chromosome segregation protein SMC, partial [Gemmatimonadetes bacterium]|nr:chromosome segregation protein SMC [Gemmatimonadota bacterium]
GLGANAYSIIEARMIDAILSDRAEERRALFEEAAEVGRYKDRRRTALRRLDQAEHDLDRLEDVLGEVRSKVRSLGRQRGRARKYEDLKERRLQLEVAVADVRLQDMESRLREAETGLQVLKRRQPEQEAHLRQRETEAENLRLHLVEGERGRSEVAGELEHTRERAEGLERDRLLALERVSTAEARIRAITVDLEGVHARRGELDQNVADLEAEIGRARAELTASADGMEALEAAVEDLRAGRQAVEGREQEALAALAQVIREAGALEAEGEAVRERTREWERELERRTEQIEGLQGTVGESMGRMAELEEAHERAAAHHTALESKVAEARVADRDLREQLRRARDLVGALESEVSSTGAVASGLASMLAEGKDLPPAVADLLAEMGTEEGVLGVLADALEAPRDLRTAVESHIGPLLSAVLVRDWKTVRVVRDWLGGRDGEEGVVLLPVDPGPRRASGEPLSGLAQRVALTGPGKAWALFLLGEVEVGADDHLGPREGAWVTADGSGQDERGVVRLGRPTAGAGALRRRGELVELEARLKAVRLELAAAREAALSTESEAAKAGQELARLERDLAEATVSSRNAEAERDTVAGRLDRARLAVEEVGARVTELEGLLASANRSDPGDDERRSALETRRVQAEDVLARERAGHMSATAEWERENSVLQELRLELTRREAAVGALLERQARAREAIEELARRADGLAKDLEEQEQTIEGSRAAIASGEEELVGLLERRSELSVRVREAQEGLDERRAELEERETALRTERQSERESAEQRHALELDVAQLRGNRANVRERLEAEWESTFEELRSRVEQPEEGVAEDWAHELENIRTRLAGIGPVNLLAAQEFEEEKERLDFLEAQKGDLEKARADLHDSIRRINESASTAFSRVFSEVRENFHRIFRTLFEGGDADVWLEDPDDPLDSPIEISASPRGKKTQRIHLLSGGERALTALALLFAIYLAKPSPFCVMDEVDAPLDETNIGRFTAMLERFKGDTQFVVITHNARTIEAADWIYGVTMQELGVSKIVSVEIQDLPRGQVA